MIELYLLSPFQRSLPTPAMDFLRTCPFCTIFNIFLGGFSAANDVSNQRLNYLFFNNGFKYNIYEKSRN